MNPFTVSLPSVTELTYNLGDPVETYTLSSSPSVSPSCPSATFLYQHYTTPSFAEFYPSNLTWVYETSDSADVGTHSMVLYVQIANGAYDKETIELEVIDCSANTISSTSYNSVSYLIGTDAVSLGVPSWTTN